jgi:hypothetical protein
VERSPLRWQSVCSLKQRVHHRGRVFEVRDVGFEGGGTPHGDREILWLNELEAPLRGELRRDEHTSRRMEEVLDNIPHAIEHEASRVDHRAVKSTRKVRLEEISGGEGEAGRVLERSLRCAP